MNHKIIEIGKMVSCVIAVFLIWGYIVHSLVSQALPYDEQQHLIAQENRKLAEIRAERYRNLD